MTRSVTPSITTTTSLTEWDFYPEGSALKRWVRELLALSNRPDADTADWALTGQGVLIKTDDIDFAAQLVRKVAETADFQFLELNRHQVWYGSETWMDGLLDPEQNRRPTMVFLQPGRWMAVASDDLKRSLRFYPEPEFDAASAALFRVELANFMKDSIKGWPLITASAVKSTEQIDPALRCVSAFDRYIGLPELEPEQIAEAFVKGLGSELLDEETNADRARLGYLLNAECGHDRRRRELMKLAARRLALREGRQIGFRDLIELSMCDFVEAEYRQLTGDEAWRTAVHEAGHVLISYLETPDQETIPEYCAIIEWENMLGITVDCYKASANKKTWQDLIKSLRVSLGGRAAEHLVLGVQSLSISSSRSDLESVTYLIKMMVEDYGLQLLDETFEQAMAHLMVSSGPLSASELAYNEARIRAFINRQYRYCFDLLRDHEGLLTQLATALREDIVLDRQGLQRVLEPLPSKENP